MRTIPVLDAQSFANQLGYPNAPIILYSEQEPAPTIAEVQAAEHSQRVAGNNADLADINMRRRRLKAYQSGLFKKVGLAYACAQPDFSTSEQITAKGGPTMVGLQGIWRIVGDECANKTTGRILRTAVSAVYDMYEASGLDPRAIQQARESLQLYPPDDAEIPLVQPTVLIL